MLRRCSKIMLPDGKALMDKRKGFENTKKVCAPQGMFHVR